MTKENIRKFIVASINSYAALLERWSVAASEYAAEISATAFRADVKRKTKTTKSTTPKTK
jgi:hypothetical protein